jgi:transcriptional regulator with XRE-family HTH domain
MNTTTRQRFESAILTRNWLGEVIAYQRKEAGLSASQLSTMAGYSSSYVAKIESGKLEPSVGAFARLALVLGLSNEEVAWLIRIIGTPREIED